MAESRSTAAGKPEISLLKRAKAAANAGFRYDRHGQCQITRNGLENCQEMRLFTDRKALNTKQISEMGAGDLNTASQGSNLPEIRDRKWSDFQRISNILTVQDGQPCDTPENQNPKIPHEYAQRRKIGPEGPDGRAGGIRTHDPYTPSVVRYQTALQPVSVTGGKDTSTAAAWQARKMAALRRWRLAGNTAMRCRLACPQVAYCSRFRDPSTVVNLRRSCGVGGRGRCRPPGRASWPR